MKVYILLAMFLRFAVSFLLLLGANRICGRHSKVPRLLLAAAVGVVYAAACFVPELHFLGNRLWYIVFTILMGIVAFGLTGSAVRPITVFALMNLVLDSVAADHTDIITGILGIIGLLILCFLGVRNQGGGLVPVQLIHEGKRVSVTALRDTGNRLIDPITGRPMLVVGAEVAQRLTGLTAEQLKKPVESVSLLPGLRLVPYSTIGQAGALMLAMRLQEVKIGSWKGSGLVAFAPQRLGTSGTYQALTGGIL